MPIPTAEHTKTSSASTTQNTAPSDHPPALKTGIAKQNASDSSRPSAIQTTRPLSSGSFLVFEFFDRKRQTIVPIAEMTRNAAI